MDRRHLIVAASAGLTMPFLLDKVGAAEPMSKQGMSKEGMSEYKTKTLLVGTLSKKMSELAAEKAGNARVKEFSGFEIAEQTAVAQVLTDKLDPPPPPLPAMDKEKLEKLAKMSGAAFEKGYLTGQIEGHEKLLAIQDAYLKDKGMATDDGHIARLAKMVIQMHLSMLRDLEKLV